MITIDTDRLTIRNFRPGDWKDLQEVIIKYQESEYARYDHKWPTSVKEIRNITSWFADGDDYLAVCLKTTRELIGLISINFREEQDGRVHNLGYIFHTKHQGQGYATESCQATMNYLFGQLVADGILTGTYPDNTPSVSLLKKLGFKETPQGDFAISRKEWLAIGQVSGKRAEKA